jgi:hypothetical protein
MSDTFREQLVTRYRAAALRVTKDELHEVMKEYDRLAPERERAARALAFPELVAEVRELRRELEEAKQKAAFVDEMAKINKARREGAVDGYCETEHCQHWDGDACAMLWLCSDVALAWDCWQEAQLVNCPYCHKRTRDMPTHLKRNEQCHRKHNEQCHRKHIEHLKTQWIDGLVRPGGYTGQEVQHD